MRRMALIGIGDAQPRQDLHFQRLHHLGVLGTFMIITGQMQHAMHHQMGGMVGEGSCPPPWLLCLVTP